MKDEQMKDKPMNALIRSSFICLSFILLSACGFSPMYGKHNQQALSAGFRIDTSSTAVQGGSDNNYSSQMSRQLKQELEDKLNIEGAPASPAYSLSVGLDSAIGGMGVARDGTVLRYNVTLISRYVLTRNDTKQIIQTGEIRHVSSYNNQVNQYYSTYISQKDALKRGVTELAELYRQRIGALVLKKNPT